MEPLPHHYECRLQGGPEGHVEIRSPGLPALRCAPPKDFGGPGDAWSPEHLLLASVQSCFLFTLRAVARASKLEFRDLEVDATGTLDRQDGRLRFTDILLKVRLVVPPGTDQERAEKLLEKSERGCLVSASLATPVRLETQVVEG